MDKVSFADHMTNLVHQFEAGCITEEELQNHMMTLAVQVVLANMDPTEGGN